MGTRRFLVPPGTEMLRDQYRIAAVAVVGA